MMFIAQRRMIFILLCSVFAFSNAAFLNETGNYTVSVFIPDHDVILLVGNNQTVALNVERNSSQSEDDRGFAVSFIIADSAVTSVQPEVVIVHLQRGQVSANFSLVVSGNYAGKTTVTANSSDPSANVVQSFLRVTVSRSDALNVFSSVVGWIYFVAWSVSFYPQIYENWKRKSVIGLNFDFLGLNIIGFSLYGLFNIGLYWITPIQVEYFERHPTGVNPVQLNDVIFALHAAFACVITITQCCLYERGHQTVSRVCKLIVVGIVLFLGISLILSLSSVLEWIDFLYFCSYVKLFITIIKYIPQAYMNFRRKSTMGWSIGNVLLDFTGGTLSIAQMFIQSYNNNDWGSIFGDPTKFGLGLFSVIFDLFFVVQHYVLYRNSHPSEPLINNLDREDEEDRSPSDTEQPN